MNALRVNDDAFGVRVIIRAGYGEELGRGVIEGYAEHPTFVIRRDSDGKQIHWAAHLCEDARTIEFFEAVREAYS